MPVELIIVAMTPVLKDKIEFWLVYQELIGLSGNGWFIRNWLVYQEGPTVEG